MKCKVLTERKRAKNFDSIRNFINYSIDDSGYNGSMIEKFINSDWDDTKNGREHLLSFAILEYMSKKFNITKRELAIGILGNFLTFTEIGKIIGSVINYSSNSISIERTRQIYHKLERKMSYNKRKDELIKIFQEDNEIDKLKNEILRLQTEKERLLELLKQQSPMQQEEYKDILEREIDFLEFSVRTTNCLRIADRCRRYNDKLLPKIIYIKDLLQYTKQDLMLLPNFGKKSLEEIIHTLELHNLSLKDS